MENLKPSAQTTPDSGIRSTPGHRRTPAPESTIEVSLFSLKSGNSVSGSSPEATKLRNRSAIASPEVTSGPDSSSINAVKEEPKKVVPKQASVKVFVNPRGQTPKRKVTPSRGRSHEVEAASSDRHLTSSSLQEPAGGEPLVANAAISLSNLLEHSGNACQQPFQSRRPHSRPGSQKMRTVNGSTERRPTRKNGSSVPTSDQEQQLNAKSMNNAPTSRFVVESPSVPLEQPVRRATLTLF